MNYDDIVSAVTHGEKLNNLPLRVTYYCRVSTDSDVQLNSLDNQLSYYENYIKSKTNWTYVKGYVEEGVTGVRVDKRPEFKKMMNDAIYSNRFDLIITKEASRFARDLEDSIHSIRELKKVGVGVFFESQNLNTFDPNSELVLNIMFNLAQEESKKLSARVKFGHKQAIKNGHVLGSSNITGYKKDKCKLVIVEDEAKFIRLVFQLYATGEYGFQKLAKKLSDMGYYNKKGKIYDKDSLKRMICNPKYKGFYRAHTYEIMDYRTKRRKIIPIEEQIITKSEDGIVPAIVTEEIWNKANEVLNVRTKAYKNNNYWSGGLKYSFSSKIYCKEHNTNFQRTHGRRRKRRPTWSCGMYLQYRLSACKSPIIAEKDLYKILHNVMNSVIPNKKKVTDNMLEIYSKIKYNNEYKIEFNNLESKIKQVELKKTETLDLVLNGYLSKDNLKIQFEQFQNELVLLEQKKKNVLSQIELISNKKNNLDRISKSIKKELTTAEFLNQFVRKFVDEIIVSKIDNNRYNIKLDIYLDLLGEEKSKSRGSKYINDSNLNNTSLYIENQSCKTIEKKRVNDQANMFVYNVYVNKNLRK